MRKSFVRNFIRPASSVEVVCDQFPLQPQNINPKTGWPRSDVSLFELAQRGLVHFDGNRISPLPDVGQRTSLDNPARRYCDTLSEKQEAYVSEQLRKQRQREKSEVTKKAPTVEVQVEQPAAVSAE